MASLITTARRELAYLLRQISAAQHANPHGPPDLGFERAPVKGASAAGCMENEEADEPTFGQVADTSKR